MPLSHQLYLGEYHPMATTVGYNRDSAIPTRVQVAPPKEVCDACFVEMTEPVEVENVGTIINCTTLHFPFVDPETGVQKEVPYSFGNIQLDGADSLIQNYLVADDLSKIKVGARIEIEFQEKEKTD